MTDDAANISPRSLSDTADTAAPPAVAAGAGDGIAGLAVTPPRFGSFAGTPGVDIELLGRGAPPAAMEAAERLVPMGTAVGAAEATPARTPYVVSAAPGAVATAPPPADLPRWSFGTPEPAASSEHNQVELPFLSAPPAPPMAATPMPTFGPVGKTRSPLAVPLLAVVTLGAYALVWTDRLNRELEEFDAKLHARPRRTSLAVAVPWMAGLLVSIAGAVLIVAARLNVQLPLDPHLTTVEASLLLLGLAVVPYLTMVLPFSLVAVVMTLERLRSVEEHTGVTTDRQVRPVGLSMLLGIPLVGGLILLGIEQRRANRVWASVAPTGYMSS